MNLEQHHLLVGALMCSDHRLVCSHLTFLPLPFPVPFFHLYPQSLSQRRLSKPVCLLIASLLLVTGLIEEEVEEDGRLWSW